MIPRFEMGGGIRDRYVLSNNGNVFVHVKWISPDGQRAVCRLSGDLVSETEVLEVHEVDFSKPSNFRRLYDTLNEE